MKPKKDIPLTPEGFLDSLDGLQKASPGPFFFTRVQARLQKEEKTLWGRMSFFITKPSVALATLCIILLVNAGVLLYQHDNKSAAAAFTEQADQNSDDYNTTLAANTYYDENTDGR